MIFAESAGAHRRVTAARRGGYPVFFTRHMSLPPRLMGVTRLRTAMAWQRTTNPEQADSWFLRDSPGFQIVPGLAPGPDEAVITDACGGRDEPAMRRVLEHMRFSGDAMLTGIDIITPLLAGSS